MILSAMQPTWTPTAVADTVDFTNNGHHTIVGGVAGQRSEVRKIEIAGQAGASAPTILVFGRTSTVGTTPTATRIAPNDGSSVLIATPPISYITNAAGTKSQRSATLGMLANLGLNAYGGLLHWFPGPDQRIAMMGVAASTGELSINAFTGGTPGAISSNVVLETV